MSREKLRQKKNSGVTLIELLLVITILAILSSGAYSMTGVLTGRGARKTADELTGLLSKAKVTAMGRSKGAGRDAYHDADVYLRFCEAPNHSVGAVLVGSQDESVIRLTSTDVTISAVLSSRIDDRADTSEIEIADVRLKDGSGDMADDNSGVRIAFDRRNGAMIPYSSIKDNDGTFTKKYVRKLIVKQGSKSITIRITPATGTIYEEP